MSSYFVQYKDNDKKKGQQFWALTLGALIYMGLGLLPFGGWIIKIILFLIGVGTIWIDSRTMIKKGVY